MATAIPPSTATPPSASTPLPNGAGQPRPVGPPPLSSPPRRRGGLVAAAVLIALGVLLLIQDVAAPGWSWDLLWPIVLVIIGAAVGLQPLVYGEPIHYTRSFWAAALIAVGALFLIGNVGYFNGWQVDRLADLWPLILVLIGVEVLITRTLPRQTAAAAGAAVAVLAVAAAVVYVALGPAVGAGTIASSASAAIGDLQRATLDLNVGGATVTIYGNRSADQLYGARFRYNNGEGAVTTVDRSSGVVRIDLQNQAFIGPSRGRSVDLSLTGHIPWSITISGGATRQVLDLSGLKISRLTISGGAQQVIVILPPASGTVPIDINAGAATLTIHRPAESEASVLVSGGVNEFTADGQHQSTLAGEMSWQSSGYGSTADRYTIHVSGGANHVVLDAQ